MSGEIPDTPAVREQRDKETAVLLTKLGLSADHVDAWEDGYRTVHEAHAAFEWWYFDAQFDDGSAAVITFATKPQTHPDAPLSPSLLIIYKSPYGERIKLTPSFSPDDFHADTAACDVQIGPNWVRGDLASYDLHVETEAVEMDLHLERQSPSWRPGAAINYFDQAHTKYFAWVVPIPYGTATGIIRRSGTSTAVTGAVYHDHNWGNAVMGHLLDHWYWGRAHVGDFTLIFTEMVTVQIFGMGGTKLPVFLLARGDKILTDDGLPLRLVTSGDVTGPGGQTYPTRLSFAWERDGESARLIITNPELIEVLDMTEDLPGWRRRLAHVFGNPLYYDFEADLELTVDMAGVRAHETGRVIFEKMMFR